jgi:hypothetical protein
MLRHIPLRTFALVSCVALSASVPEPRPSPIPSGTYVSIATRERVVVTPTKMFLDVRYRRRDDGSEQRYAGEVNYSVTSDGKIYIGFPSSGVAFHVGMYEFHWNGHEIIKFGSSQWEKGSQIVFIPQ